METDNDQINGGNANQTSSNGNGGGILQGDTGNATTAGGNGDALFAI